jgi:hypothetical protein
MSAQDIAADLGEEAAKRCLRAVMDLVSLSDDPKDQFVIFSLAISALVGGACVPFQRITGAPKEVPNLELAISVLKCGFEAEEKHRGQKK